MPPPATLLARVRLPGAILAVIGLLVLALPGLAGAALPNHNFPRTFHMWAGYQAAQHPKYDLLMGYGTPRQGAYPVAEIRRRNPAAILMMTPGAVTGGAWVHSNLSYGGGITGFPGGTDPELGHVPPFAESERVFDAAGQPQRCANYARPEVALHVAKIMALEAKAGGLYRDDWDGIGTDGWSHPIGESWYCGSNIDLNRDGRADETETMRREFHRGLEIFADALHSYIPGKLIGGNGPWYKPEIWRGADPNGWATRFADYSSFEHLERRDNPDSFIAEANGWMGWSTGRQRLTSATMSALDASNNPAPRTVSETDPDAQRSCRWGLTVALMTSIYYLCGPEYDHGAFWWMDEYYGGAGVAKRGYLGQPLGPAQKLPGGVWRRDFQGGVALNNSTGATQTIALGPGFRLIQGGLAPSVNTGQGVSSLALGPRDGRVVLRNSFIGTFVEPTRTPGSGLPGPAGRAGKGSVRSAALGPRARIIGLRRGQVVSGRIRWRAGVARTGSPLARVTFFVDRESRWVQRSRPWQFGGSRGRLDTRKLSNGRHVLAIRAKPRRGRALTARVTVIVRNRGGLPTAERPGRAGR